MHHRRAWAAAIAALGILLLAAPSSGGPLPPAVLHAKSLLESPPSNVSPDSLWRALGNSEQELREYLRSGPSSTEAVLILMQVHEAHSLITSIANLLGGDAPVDEMPEDYDGFVAQALKADSLNAQLHYWRSRLWSVPKLSPSHYPLGIPRLGGAVEEARRTVALAPKERAYRENLAYLLFVSGDERTAITMYKSLDRNHPMYLMLHDWERLPAIEGAVALPDSFRFLLPISSPLAFFAAAGMRSYVFDGTAAQLEANCRKLWPTFQLLLDQDTTRYSKGVRRYAQHLRWDGDRLEPDAKASDVQGGTEPGVGDGGLWVEVREQVALESDPPNRHPGVKPGETYCVMEFHNKRAPWTPKD